MIGTWRRTAMAGLGIAALALSAGCFRHTVDVGGGARHAPVVYDHWEHFWLAGLVGRVHVDVAHMCPSGEATIEARQTFLNGLVAGLTSGIYTPTTLRVRCRDGRHAEVELSAEDAARAAGDPSFLELVAEEMPARAGEVAEAQAAQLP